MKNSFDIVICLLIVSFSANLMAILFFSPPSIPQRHRTTPFGEHLLESYDEGFIDAITRFINDALNEVDQDYIGKDLVYARAKTLCAVGNSIDKVKMLGQLQIKEIENKIVVVFAARSKKTGSIS
jgi:hypothetical protein